MIAPIQGGYNVQERIRSATFLSEHNDLLGFLLDGFFTDGLTVENIPSDLIIPIIDKTMVIFYEILLYTISLQFTIDQKHIFFVHDTGTSSKR